MKKYIVIFILTAGIVSCGGKKKADGLALASEVCECRQKGKGLKFSDPEAKKNQDGMFQITRGKLGKNY